MKKMKISSEVTPAVIWTTVCEQYLKSKAEKE